MTNAEILDTVKERLVETYKPDVIYLFGSFAWGEPDGQSDLDLMVVVDSSDEKHHKRGIRGSKSLRGLNIAKDILVYTWEEFNELSGDVSSLCYKVKNEGVKLYEAA